MSNELTVEIRDHIAYVTFDRPTALNSISHELNERLSQAWDEIDDDPDIWVVILASSGEKAFCAGADISGGTDTHSSRLAFGGGLTGVGGPLRTLKKPLIVAVQGYALGGGFELAMCGDIIVAAENAQFGLPEVKAGIIGESGVMHRALRQLPHHVAMALILTGDRLPAADAYNYGLVNQVVPIAELGAAATTWAKKITAVSPLAAQAAKHAATVGLRGSLEVALSTKYEPIEAYAKSEDVREGRLAFQSKRAPEWTGR